MEVFQKDTVMDKYYNKKIYDVKNYFNEKNREVLKKLDIEIGDKIYTEYEYDIIRQKLLDYVKPELIEEDEEVIKDLQKYQKSLSEKGVKQEEFDEMFKKFNAVEDDYKQPKEDNV